MLKRARKQLDLSARCLQVGERTRKKHASEDTQETVTGLPVRVMRPPGTWPVRHRLLASPSASAQCWRRFKTGTTLVLLIQILVSRENEVTLNARETLQQLSHRNAAV